MPYIPINKATVFDHIDSLCIMVFMQSFCMLCPCMSIGHHSKSADLEEVLCANLCTNLSNLCANHVCVSFLSRFKM